MLALLSLLLLAPQPDWRAFSPKDAAFTVEFPAAPTEHKKTVKGMGGTVEVVFYEVELPGDRKFLVGVSEFPETSIKAGTEDKRLDNARDGAVNSVKGKLRREKALVLDSHPGRELVIDVEGKASVVLRMYAVKNRLYQVVVVGNGEFVSGRDAEKFLLSFKVAR